MGLEKNITIKWYTNIIVSGILLQCNFFRFKYVCFFQMTIEPPQGVRDNLLRSYVHIGEKAYDEQCSSQPAWKTLLLSLCFFNSVIHERKKYGRLGWNIPYEFNDSDFEVNR